MNNKTICILQLTRFGDLLQTTKAASILKQEHPNVRLILVARKQFATPLNFILNSVFDKIVELDAKQILSGTDEIQLEKLNLFLSHLNNQNISALVNLSFSKTSSYLASVIKAEHKLGPHYDQQTNLIIHDNWSQYVYSSVMSGPLNPFNLVDLFRLILGSKKSSLQLRPTSNKNNIVFHPFASLDKKKWKESKWCDVIYKTLKDNPSITVHLVGAPNEVEYANKIVMNPILKRYQDRLVSHVGKKSIEDLANLIQESRLFVGHDSMVSHLASFYDIPILTIPLGCVRPIETAPYSKNVYVLTPKSKCFPCFPDTQCEHLKCHSDVPYQVISSTINQLLTTGDINSDLLKDENSCFNLNSTTLSKVRFSVQGLLEFNNILEDELSFKNLMQIYYRIAWLYLLSECEEKVDFPKISPSLHQQLLNHLPGLQHIFELTEFGKKYCRFILQEIGSDTPNVGQIKSYSQKIDEIDSILQELTKTFPAFTPILNYYAISKGNIIGDNIVELTQHSHINYDETSSLVSIIYELIEKSITEYKHKSATLGQRSI